MNPLACIHTCNEYETAIDTVALWTLVNAARLHYLAKSAPKDLTPEEFAAPYEAGIECLKLMQHIERTCNNGVPLS